MTPPHIQSEQARRQATERISGLLLVLLVLLALWQAAAAELWNDEAYYWVFSLHPALGYLDHPPMIALWIKAGTGIFGDTQFGVRFVPLCAYISSFFLLLAWSRSVFSLEKIMLWSGVVAFSLAGMLAVPDAPLLFFTLLYFIAFKSFQESPSLRSSFFLALCIAGMLYSKYHGILPVFAALLFFPGLFRQKWFYVTAAFSVLLFMPHVYWQYKNGFPSIAYHLHERSQAAYRWNFTAEYVVNQLLLFGPFVSWFLFVSVWRARKSKDSYSRYLAFVFVFVLLFFLVSSFKGNVEANWTAIALYPALYLSFQAIDETPSWKKPLRYFYFLSFLLLIAGKVFFLYPGASGWVKNRNEWHGSRQWAKALSTRAGKLPVVFNNSYQLASRFMFYAHRPSMSVNTPGGRRNQFEFWPYEDNFRYKDVLLVTGSRGADCDSVFTSLSGWVHVKQVKNFFSFMHLSLQMDPGKLTLAPGEKKEVMLHIHSPEQGSMPNKEDKVFAGYLITGKPGFYSSFTDTVFAITGHRRDVPLVLQAPAEKGKYHLQFLLQPQSGISTINSTIYSLTVQ